MSDWPEHNTPEEIMAACGLPDKSANLPGICEHCGRRAMVWIYHKGISSTCPQCAIKWLREAQAKLNDSTEKGGE